MEEKTFLKTMIETVKYDDYDRKNELLTILRNSRITYDKTNEFTRKSWQSWENINLRVPIPMLKIARELEKVFENIASEIYIETDNYDFGNLKIKPKPVDLEQEDIKEHDVIFSEIKDTIIQGIRSAKYTLWIAVAWFTDEEIFKELISRKNEGVNIRIITSSNSS